MNTLTMGTPLSIEEPSQAVCRLVIDSARYGIRKNIPLNGHPGVIAEKTVWEWVGWKLRPLIEGEQLYVGANYPSLGYNGLFGDPYEGVFKKLIVRFHYDCGTGDYTQHRVCVWEDQDLVITPTTENTWCINDAPDEGETTPS